MHFFKKKKVHLILHMNCITSYIFNLISKEDTKSLSAFADLIVPIRVNDSLTIKAPEKQMHLKMMSP